MWLVTSLSLYFHIENWGLRTYLKASSFQIVEEVVSHLLHRSSSSIRWVSNSYSKLFTAQYILEVSHIGIQCWNPHKSTLIIWRFVDHVYFSLIYGGDLLYFRHWTCELFKSNIPVKRLKVHQEEDSNVSKYAVDRTGVRIERCVLKLAFFFNWRIESWTYLL